MAQSLSQQKAAAQTSANYRPRQSTSSKLFALVQRNWLGFLADARVSELEPAPYIVREFEEYLGCGVLAKGFVRLKCESCAENQFIPFSCKRRGFCPSCCGRRMNEGSAFLVDNVFPHVPVRQWVLSMPIPVRYWMARNPHLITHALAIFHRAMQGHYRLAARKLGVGGKVHTGAITVVQRFGSALNLNIHFHAIVLDGVYLADATFIETNRPTEDEMRALIQTIQGRLLKLFQRRGLVSQFEEAAPDAEGERPDSVEALCQGASVQYRLALGPNHGQRVRRIGSLGFAGEKAQTTGELSAVVGGYSLHANTHVHGNNRPELERLCRYVLRPPIAEERIEFRGSQAVYKLKSKWTDGTTSILLSGTEFIEKLVALIPQPRIHLTRFHGVLAPHSKMRAQIVPASQVSKEPKPGSEPTQTQRAHRLEWSELLRRTFQVDLTQCTKCGGRVKFIAAITEPNAIYKILTYLGLPAIAPKFLPP